MDILYSNPTLIDLTGNKFYHFYKFKSSIIFIDKCEIKYVNMAHIIVSIFMLNIFILYLY